MNTSSELLNTTLNYLHGLVFMWRHVTKSPQILGLHVTSWRPCWWNFNKRMLISFYCTWHQHGRYVFVFWISRDWLQTINSRYHFFDSRNGYSSVILVKLPNDIACYPTWPPHTNLSYGNIDIFELQQSYMYFAKIVTRKPKIGNLTNMTELYPFVESKSGICYFRGFCGHL